MAYFAYFGDAAGDPDEGYYSYDLGSWHIIALNSSCGEGEVRCGPGSAQTEWLKLTLNPKSYGWRFISVEGESFSDSGSARCN